MASSSYLVLRFRLIIIFLAFTLLLGFDAKSPSLLFKPIYSPREFAYQMKSKEKRALIIEKDFLKSGPYFQRVARLIYNSIIAQKRETEKREN